MAARCGRSRTDEINPEEVIVVEIFTLLCADRNTSLAAS